MSCRSRVSRAVLSSPNSAIDAPSDNIVVTTAVTTQALSTFIAQLLVWFARMIVPPKRLCQTESDLIHTRLLVLDLCNFRVRRERVTEILEVHQLADLDLPLAVGR